MATWTNGNLVVFQIADDIITEDIPRLFYEVWIEHKTDVELTQEVLEELTQEIPQATSQKSKKDLGSQKESGVYFSSERAI